MTPSAAPAVSPDSVAKTGRSAGVVARILLLLAAAAMAVAYFFPLWRIGLAAPQYPEGLWLDIWIDRLAGDLQTISILNHYIGMKAIKPEDFAELKYFPWALGGMVALCVLAGLWGRKVAVRSAGVIVTVLACAALYDFYAWEYRYGHDLDPEAAIIMDGMEYQPPLIGEKTLLNITASSWPAPGGYAFSGGVVLALVAAALTLGGRRAALAGARALSVLLIALPFVGSGCVRGTPSPLAYGQETCEQCRMVLVDRKFGAEFVTDKGKRRPFDSIECAVRYLDGNDSSGTLYVVDFERPGTLVKAAEAGFVVHDLIKSPMGGHVAALSGPTAGIEALLGAASGSLPRYGWSDMRARLAGQSTD